MPSRSLADLRPVFRARATDWYAECKAIGLDLLVYCTLRTTQEQDELYQQGRSQPGRIVTYAKPGQSAHNHGLALDFVPLILGKPDWRAGSPEYLKAVELAEKHGMSSASKWKKFREWPHLEMPEWRAHI